MFVHTLKESKYSITSARIRAPMEIEYVFIFKADIASQFNLNRFEEEKNEHLPCY